MANTNVVKDSLDKAPKSLESFIRRIFSSPGAMPIMTVRSVMDFLFKDEKWWEYEPETISQMLRDAGVTPLSLNVLNQIHALAAVLYGKSYIDKEWNLFEKCVLAFTGIPVLFFDNQNVPIEYVQHTLKIIKLLAKVELSEEVRHYIGSEAINDEILWHPDKEIDDCIVLSLGVIGSSIGLNADEVAGLRTRVAARFDALKKVDLSTYLPDVTSAEDLMCMAIIRSLMVGKSLKEAETTGLAMWGEAKNGKMIQEGLSDNIPTTVANDSHDLDNMTDQVFSSEMVPDTDEFDQSVKEAFANHCAENAVAMEDKAASITGSPVPTGIPLSGMEDTSYDPDRDLEKTEPVNGTASQKMQKAVSNEKDTSKDKPEDGFNIFNS